MIRFSNILCPTDFSSFAQAALPVACSLARDYGAKLILLNVRPIPPGVVGEFGTLPPEPDEPDELLRTRMRRHVPSSFGGDVECLVVDGDAAEEIVKAAELRSCDLIVLGTHGRTGLRRLLLGSVAEAVLRQAPCPVLTIKPAPVEALAAASGDNAAQVEPNTNSAEMVTVCSVANPVEAEVIRSALNGERIPCVVEGAQQAGFAGTLGIPIRIQVRVDDFNRANKFIQMREAHHV